MYHPINQLSQESKDELEQKINSYSEALGGKNAFLKLLRNDPQHISTSFGF